MKGVLLLIIVLLSGLGALYYEIVNGENVDMGHAEFADQQIKVSFWTNFNMDSINGPSLYYRIHEGRSPKVPTTYLTTSFHWPPLKFRKFEADDGNLLAVTYSVYLEADNDDQLSEYRRIIIYDMKENMSWPRDDIGNEDFWRVRFEKMMTENPEIKAQPEKLTQTVNKDMVRTSYVGPDI